MKGSLSCSSFEGLADTRLRRLRRKRMGPRFFCCYCRFVSSEEEEVSGLMEWIARVLTEEEREGEGRGGGGERADGMDGLFLFSPLLSSFPSPGGDASVAFFPHPSLPFLFSFLTWLRLQAGGFDIGLRVTVQYSSTLENMCIFLLGRTCLWRENTDVTRRLTIYARFPILLVSQRSN